MVDKKQAKAAQVESVVGPLAVAETRSAPAGSPEWLDELDCIAASYGFPPVRDCVDYTTQEYAGKTPEEVFQEDWLDYAEDDGE